MVKGDIAGQATEKAAKKPPPAPRALSSARVDEEVQGGEFWVLMRAAGILIGLVVVVGWIIG
ncbi:hypothetical protein GGQ83_001416 [Roseococcus suduntuyensis]|uniref:Uncharacterized protein n=2 Tax=Roseococcus suduntuyensis TaxID=455361 RepID=A0A840A8Y8_9PROT|nr:hypothetical protein [Roseococcus suduntuyensis]